MAGLCLQCLRCWEGERCPSCASQRVVVHPELLRLTIAHMDCDCFYASVEKRDRPLLHHKPVAIGGDKRGVVAAACYVARQYGVRSAMPMFEARRRCPDLVVLAPDMRKYKRAGQAIRGLMRAVTPLVEPLSLDEAYLDLSASESEEAAALRLARLARRIEIEVGVSVSVGLGSNKFLAKMASGMDKPRGFVVLSKREAAEVLQGRDVGCLWGVGPQLVRRLRRAGIVTVGQLQARSPESMERMLGKLGRQLVAFSHGEDERKVTPTRESKSVSAETTFAEDTRSLERLMSTLAELAEGVAGKLQREDLGCWTVTLKLKTADFKAISRSVTLPAPTASASKIVEAGRALLLEAMEGERAKFRLVGIGGSGLTTLSMADPPDLI